MIEQLFANGDAVKRILIASALVLTFGTYGAMAQNCTSGTQLYKTDIASLVGGRYACAGTPPNLQWNELHTGGSGATSGSVLDYKLGPTSTTDPSATPANPTGSYTISGGNGTTGNDFGTVTYTYGSLTYAYGVSGTATGTAPGTYSFCGKSGAPNLLVTISVSHC
jgi:hypothetical protein